MARTTAEFALIEQIRARVRGNDRLSIPIGDDTACFDFPDPARSLITTDMLMEGTHFTRSEATPAMVGRKALAVNLSDIAAMAGRPLAAFVSIALPRGADDELTTGLYDGLLKIAEEFDVVIAGGDTNAWDGPLVISVTVLGEATNRGPVTRNGAKPGDWIFVTGELGGSRLGRQFEFTPRILEAQQLHAAVDLHAMIDLSDGLSSDLLHVLDESEVGATVFADRIPISPLAKTMADDMSPLEHALSDGEDFELLFAVSPDDGLRLQSQSPIATPLHHLGEIVGGETRELILPDGQKIPWVAKGWQHAW